jgi:hypothetical protein
MGHQMLVYANGINVLGDNINTQALIDASKEDSLSVEAEKSKYMLRVLLQNTG